MQGQRTSRWIPVDSWLKREEARLDPTGPRTIEELLARSLATPDPVAQQPAPEPGGGYRPMRGVPRGTCLLDHEQAMEAAELAASIGVQRAAVRFGVHRRTLRDAWNRYGIDVTPPGGGRRRRVA